MSKTTVNPVSPVAPYIGGKRNLAKRICPIIDAVDHTTYAEPFVGMGGIFQLTTRNEFNRLVATNPDTLTDLERAARFLYLQRTAFGGKVSGKNFGVAKDRPGRFNLTDLEPMLEDLHCRLSGVVIECLDYAEFIGRYDSPSTFFYLDPPYWGCENDYGKGLVIRADFDRMNDRLSDIQGRFLLSINDVPEIRDTFAGFHIVPVKTTYTINKSNGPRERVGELLISNFKWE